MADLQHPPKERDRRDEDFANVSESLILRRHKIGRKCRHREYNSQGHGSSWPPPTDEVVSAIHW
ncbi:hypothetical protein RRF57_008068 [Xylaria bambusicola]|uniref:Uncharacterized protein n=1 Tax=Xylaria bambusicola TaxID=326684 RepID=A0AAN7UWE6_9PEZI